MEYRFLIDNRENAERIVREINRVNPDGVREVRIEDDPLGYLIVLVLQPPNARENYQFYRGFIQGMAAGLENVNAVADARGDEGRA